MKTGVYKTAKIVIKHPNGYLEIEDIQEASLTVYPSQMAEIIHYLDGDKTPSKKITICIPTTSLVSFRAEGYAS